MNQDFQQNGQNVWIPEPWRTWTLTVYLKPMERQDLLYCNQTMYPHLQFDEDVFWQCLISLLLYLPRNNECCLALCMKTESISHSSIRHSPCPTWAIYPCRTKLQRFFLFVLHLNLTSIKQLRLGPSNYQANLLHNISNTCDECNPAMDLKHDLPSDRGDFWA